MDPIVFVAVLTAAACHAGWNALLKLDAEPVVATALVAAASGMVAAPFALFLGLPDPAAWPYVLASVAIHVIYYLALAQAYRFGDLGHVYPIARGSAPLLTALLSTFWLGEGLSHYGIAGVVVLTGGILLLAARGGRSLGRFDARSVGFALLTSLTITGYTLVDGLGARTSHSAIQYTVWLFLLCGAAMGVYGWARIGPRLLGDFARNWKLAIAGAALSTAAYAIVIWAMTVAPIALVAALRETSVLFAAILGMVLLREPVVAARIAAACLVVAGMILVRWH